jgi:hypothetical protein
VTSFTNTGPRHNQSEESGGVLSSQHQDPIGAKRDNLDDYEDEDDDQHYDDNKDDENDIEYIIMNLYSKMKNLEGKYIDLANYYKHELVKTTTNTGRQNNEDAENAPYGGGSLPPSRLGGYSQNMSGHTPGRENKHNLDID